MKRVDLENITPQKNYSNNNSTCGNYYVNCLVEYLEQGNKIPYDLLLYLENKLVAIVSPLDIGFNEDSIKKFNTEDIYGYSKYVRNMLIFTWNNKHYYITF